MKEHILVFDHPPKFGKGIPKAYNLQVFDVPSDKKERVLGLLKHLGFVEIKDEFVDKQEHVRRNGRGTERDLCIRAQYHTEAKQVEYHNFWEKKEKIELEIDRLQVV